MKKLLNVMKIVRSILLLSMLTMISFLSFGKERTTSRDEAGLSVFEGNPYNYVQFYVGTNMLEYFSGNLRNYIISTRQTDVKDDADTIKSKKEKLKERKVIRKNKAEEKKLTDKLRKAEEYIYVIRQAEKDKHLQKANQYFEYYLLNITMKRKEFINQLNANPLSILKDQPEE